MFTKVIDYVWEGMLIIEMKCNHYTDELVSYWVCQFENVIYFCLGALEPLGNMNF